MRRLLLVLIAAACGCTAFTQDLPTFKAPRVKGDRFPDASSPAKLDKVDADIANYANRHEAAVAALQAASRERSPDRATRLLLVSLRRDPGYTQALYNIGLLCVGYERWQDALSFYGEILKMNPDPQLAKLANAEIERVKAIAQMESTPEGRKRRLFDARLVEILSKSKDPIAGLNSVAELAKLDASRWEAPALAGIFHADAGAFAESMKSLDEAARLAPATRRLQIQSAAQVARSESTFSEQKNSADGLWEKQQYEAAAKMYASAWENSPSRVDIAMDAATGFLMADQIPLAAQILSRMRDYASPDLDRQITGMLKELGAVSDLAKNEAAEPPHPAAGQSGDSAARIRTLVGQLTTPQMELAAKPSPALLQDTTRIIPVPDEELTAGHSEMALLSTDSVFGRYRKNLPNVTAVVTADVPVAAGAQPPTASIAPLAPAPAQSEPPSISNLTRPSQLSNSPAGSAPPRTSAKSAVQAKGGPGLGVSVVTTPAGATVAFDDNTELNCIAPCEMPLPAGRHTLRATLQGHREALRIFELNKKTAPIEITLDPKRGSVNVESATAGMPVFLNGNKTDKVTPARLTLDEGDWEIGIETDGHRAVQKISVKDGSLLRITF